MFAQLLARTPPVAELTEDQARLVGGLRFWLVANRSGRCPIAAAGARLGSLRAGAHVHLLLEEIGAAWPDPFAVSPPCCPRLSHDEALLTGMLEVAGRGDRPGFDRLLCDLLPRDPRERLFLSTSVLSRVLREQPGEPVVTSRTTAGDLRKQPTRQPEADRNDLQAPLVEKAWQGSGFERAEQSRSRKHGRSIQGAAPISPLADDRGAIRARCDRLRRRRQQ